jgi:hypothetical protein
MQPNGTVAVPLDLQTIARRATDGLKLKNQDLLKSEVLIMVAQEVSANRADLLLEYRTRCMVLPSTTFDEVKPESDPSAIVARPIQALLKLARERGLRPAWAMPCFPADEQIRNKLPSIMRFDNGQLQAIATDRFAYLTMLNGAIYYVF